ncbi:autotransporter outer membrane beta-barrel domain-containing protein [Stenotrophomonas maltophilia]|uniref:autotransporter family protein n=2 Tax=Stenotrophomonas maltophilia TaxID=40324 RepID=UPI0021C64135|nr:autotransporter outer membrane beta-barrel domain-containing protein [Stenotrophomonas maltophilia]
MLALLALQSSAAFSRELIGESALVSAEDPVEAWTLRAGSSLRVQNGETLGIEAFDDSVVELDGATISDPSPWERGSVLLGDTASLTARSSTFRGKGLIVMGSASVYLTSSRILVTHSEGLDPFATQSIGVDLGSTIGPVRDGTAIIDSTFIQVEDAVSLPKDGHSGLGLRLGHGQTSVQNGSRIEAANVGALLYGDDSATAPVRLTVSASTVVSGRGAAIRVAALGAQDQFDITLAENTRIHAGNGTLLHVDAFRPGLPGPATIRFAVDDSRVAGDLVFDTGKVSHGGLDIFLRNKAQIDGRFIDVTSANIGSDSTWLMTGDSNVGHLALGNTGTIALGNGCTFNTLTLDAFDGAGGTLLFNTQLGDDSSATDRLIIKGDSNGQANVHVLNAGGAGAKTDKGIELIRVGGASNAQFDLQGRAVGGQYEYFLFKDATNGGWYLRSELAGAPDPCVVDPILPECQPVDPVDPVDPIDLIDPIDPTPVLRPEAGAYLANQFAMDQLLRHGWRDRQGGAAAADGIRGWARVDATQSKLSAVEDQLDLRVDRSRLQLGADIGVFDNGRGRVGVMGTLAKSDATSRSQLTGYSARGKVNGDALGVYGNWSSDALYVDASVQRGQFRNRVQGEGLAEERYNSDIWQSSLEAGYRIGIGEIGSTALSLQPELQLVYTDANTDRHQEANGTVVRGLGDSGLSGRMGLRLQGESRSTAGASVSPYVVANWYRDGASNGMAFDDEALKASVPRNRYELNAGARVDFRSGLSAWGGFGVMRGDHGYREATANLSVAYTW